jgi:hypothetical protein
MISTRMRCTQSDMKQELRGKKRAPSAEEEVVEARVEDDVIE